MGETGTARKIGAGIQYVLCVGLVLFLLLIGIAGAVTHPTGAVLYLLALAGLLGIAWLRNPAGERCYRGGRSLRKARQANFDSRDFMTYRPQPTPTPPKPRRKPTVVIADHEKVIADTLTLILNQRGYDAHAAYNSSQAVERTLSTNADLIICEVLMPDMNGIQAAIRIRHALPHCKILLMSGQAATADLLEDARARGYEFEILAKPIHPQDLLDKLRS